MKSVETFAFIIYTILVWVALVGEYIEFEALVIGLLSYSAWHIGALRIHSVNAK